MVWWVLLPKTLQVNLLVNLTLRLLLPLPLKTLHLLLLLLVKLLRLTWSSPQLPVNLNNLEVRKREKEKLRKIPHNRRNPKLNLLRIHKSKA
jgi:hypothetical protein